MRVLVTGANGFVGRSIVSELSKGADELILLDRIVSREAERPGVKFVEADISRPIDPTGLDIGNIDMVIHAAGLAHQFGPVSRETFWKVNVDGTANVAGLAAESGARHMVLISSVSVYGKPEEGISLRAEDAECKPEGPYAESKFESEKIASQISEKKGLPLTILRLATVIGEGDRGNVARLIRAIDKKTFIWIGKGENRKSLVHKDDVARACIAAMNCDHTGMRIYNVSAQPLTMKEIVSSIAESLKKKEPRIAIPPALLRAGFRMNSATLGVEKIERISGTLEKWLSDDSYSAERIATECSFFPEVSVRQALDREVAWYLNHK
jgi:nucleoside-diphosphate-sugar epimerase